MSSNKQTTNGSAQEQTTILRPRLRFSKFEGSAWVNVQLAKMSMHLSEQIGEKALTPISISAGVGFVRQSEKFGRDISGQQYQRYTLVCDGDFVYNKGNSLKFPQGCIYLLEGWGKVAAPNVFICFRLKEGYEKKFFQYCFEKNLHGLKLRKHITSSARSNGLLNISKQDFFGISFMVPSRPEQQKIAACLSSVDTLIDLETRKLNMLKVHKKGLMKELFPAEGNSDSRVRFSAFKNARKWRKATIGEVFETSSGGTPDRSVPEYWEGDIPWVSTSLVDFNHIDQAQEFITEKGMRCSSAKLFPPGTILIAMYGQGQTRGKVAILDIEATTNQACAAILPQKGIDPEFVFMYLSNCYEELRRLSNSGGQENLSQSLIRKFTVAIPWDIDEQKVIKKCLSRLDCVIAQQELQVSSLVRHKSGLMQQLFPVMGEEQE